jgi:hypothetical protein
MLRPSRYILIPAPQRVGLGSGYKVLMGSYSKMEAFATSVQKISPIWWKNRPHTLKNTIKKLLKTSKNKKKPSRL